MDGKLLLNGLFGVSKGEFDGSWEVMRLIINLVPVNQCVEAWRCGDVAILGWDVRRFV